MQYHYRTFGLQVGSDIELPALPPIETPSSIPDLQIRTCESVTERQIGQIDGGGRFIGVVQNVGRFGFIKGEKILVEPDDGVEQSRLRTALLGPVMSIALRQRGHSVLHAGCVMVDGSALLFMGPCGAGKSTLSAAFYHQGYSILGDDIAAVDCASEPVVFPGYPQIKLRKDAASFLHEDVDSLPTLHRTRIRRLEQADRGFPIGPVPLKRIYIVSRGDTVGIASISQKEALTSLIANTRGIPPLYHPKMKKSRFQQCATLAKEVSILKLKRPNSLDSLSEVTERVRQDVLS